ncbi:hypothetical protein [Ruegeria marina]|uniref:3-methyladenine DNA glycosylase AlkC n=1 Tax=Ruegeria marina TaxID=639004 RepID=A0A1G6Z571_9RHOB|nr:hypothetical protein [Ruegeria marina]SDD97799.1 3-methyladenine DNA glycosylase AlkC [Ruegeria marina]
MAQGFSLKDQLFNAEKVGYLAGLFDGPKFDGAVFRARVMQRLPELELKQRIDWIAECLSETLPGALPQVAPAILRALPPPLDPSRTDDDFGDFIFAPLGEWVAVAGIEHPEPALDLLAELTQRFSMEWAIRPFLNRWPDLVLARMRDWCDHDSYHVRRLVSEGTRPRLPWGAGIALPLDAALPLLDRLHADPTRYVTRSVANHLNDIAKKDPDLVLERLAAWREAGRQSAAERDWITAHALRGLVKAGHPGAMSMLGYDPEAPVTVTLDLPGRARIGDELALGVVLEGKPGLPVLVDYIVHFQRPGGKVSARVHKLKQARLTGGRLRLDKRHRLKGDATTFTLVPGPHRVEIQVNGRVRATGSFDLEG